MAPLHDFIPEYNPPDFSRLGLAHAPVAQTAAAPGDGVLPRNYHATSNHPEYVHLGSGQWLLAPESRMDSVLVLRENRLEVVEPRRVKHVFLVVVGRTENGEEGIYLHISG